ncbi:MAG: hypothetical protein ACRDOO_21410 [Actinomadura sp.]
MSDFFLFSISLGVTVLGLVASWRVARRRGVASGMRGAAWSLVPMAAYLTGLTEWAASLVFSPVKWAGIAVLGLAGVLYVVSGVLLRRGAGTAEVEADTGRAAAPEGSRAKGEVEPRQQAAADPDLAEIENILRKRGIS